MGSRKEKKGPSMSVFGGGEIYTVTPPSSRTAAKVGIIYIFILYSLYLAFAYVYIYIYMYYIDCSVESLDVPCF